MLLSCPWKIKSGGRRLLPLGPPRMIQRGMSELISPDVAVVVFWLLLLLLPWLIQSRALHGLLTPSLHQHGLVLVSALLHHH